MDSLDKAIGDLLNISVNAPNNVIMAGNLQSVLRALTSIPAYAGVQSVNAGTSIIVNNGDPANPIVSLDESVNLDLTGTVTFGSNYPLSPGTTPTLSNELVDKDYVDSLLAGLSPQDSVAVATAAALPACTAAGAGVGKTLTGNAIGILTVDGVATVLGDNILVKNQVAQKDNGAYVVTTEGTAGVAFVLTRRTNYDQTAEVKFGTFFGVQAGTQAGTVWIMNHANPIVVDTTAITFTFFFTGTAYTATNGVQLVGNSIRSKIVANDGLTLSGTSLTVAYDNTTIGIVGNKLAYIGTAPSQTLAQTLALGNVTGAKDLLVTDGQFISSADGQAQLDFGSGGYIYLSLDGGGSALPNINLEPTYVQISSAATTGGVLNMDNVSSGLIHPLEVELIATGLTGKVKFTAPATIDMQIGSTLVAQVDSTGLITDNITGLSGIMNILQPNAAALTIATNSASAPIQIQSAAALELNTDNDSDLKITIGGLGIMKMNGAATYTGTVAGAAGKNVVNGLIMA